MNNFFIETEAKIFCLLITAFLWGLQRRNPKAQSQNNKMVYLFSCIAVILSALTDLYALIIFRAAFGVSCALAVYFWCGYACEMKKTEKTVLHKTMFIIASIVFSALAYFTVLYTNLAMYILVFVLTVVFIISQYKKIRVDNLTKLYNRYAMDEEIKEQLMEYAREKSDSFYVIACDLDNFKHINDTWGHLEGDRALILISNALMKVGEMFDAEVFRIGGDEFVIIADTSQKEVIANITQAIKNELDNIDFRDDFKIRMSIGTALYNGEADIDKLLENADKKLYEAKKNKI